MAIRATERLEIGRSAKMSDVEAIRQYSGVPEDGILQSFALDVPDYDFGTYYAAFQKYDVIPGDKPNPYTDGANRIQPLRIDSFAGLKNGGMFLLLRLKDGDTLALLPLVCDCAASWLCSGEGDTLTLKLGTHGTAAVSGDIPLVAWAKSNDPYVACRLVWETALGHELLGWPTLLREEKGYPEPFRYLGWCSWEEYKKNINEEILLEAADLIERSGLPIRYMLVDDGHLDASQRRLRSFKPDKGKFPNGWSKLMARKQTDKLRWIGLWLNFNGYWDGIDADNEFAALNEHFAPINNGAVLPRNDELSATAFYASMIGEARRNGFDFVKVDNQSANLRLYAGTENPVQSVTHNARALESASARHMRGLINCMAHGPIHPFHTRISSVFRCSEDYVVGNLGRARRHLHNSYANMPWLGQTAWGDHDMFHSNDEVAARMLAVSKAMSGAPIYLSDNPADFRPEHIWPLCYNDGELLRTLAPAAPLPESLFVNPFEGGQPFRAIAPLTRGAAAIVVYNFTEPETPVSGTISPDDYCEAACLIQQSGQGYRQWSLPSEGLFIYDWYAGTGRRLKQPHPFTLDGFADRYYLLTPIAQGWSVIGRSDKYLSPAAVETVFADERELVICMVESGPLLLWSEREPYPVRYDGGEYAPIPGGAGLWRYELPVGRRHVAIRVAR